MIVKILSSGKSFTGLATYLSHDADQAKTAERLAWTHTHNLANDDIPCAVNEMLWTSRDAEQLKQEAGIHDGGRSTENPVKHISLNWAPDDEPSREHMLETTEDFLRHMGWHEHQAIFFAHTDKKYAHVHVMLNVVHPETGLKLDDGFERHRAQSWALDYEREHDRIYCEQRLLNAAERESAPPRNIWMAFEENKKTFENSEKSLSENQPFSSDEAKNPENQENIEWKILKEIQCAERIDFFAEGKSEFSELRLSIYREIREEFRGRWADFYATQKAGADPDTLAALKAQIVGEQTALLNARRDEASTALRGSRDERYRDLLETQRDVRAELRGRQEAGIDSISYLQSLREVGPTPDVLEAFHETAAAVTRPAGGERSAHDAAKTEEHTAEHASGGAGAAGELGLGLLTAFDSLLSIFEGAKRPAPKPRQADTGSFESAARETEKREHERKDEEEREKHKAFYRE